VAEEDMTNGRQVEYGLCFSMSDSQSLKSSRGRGETK